MCIRDSSEIEPFPVKMQNYNNFRKIDYICNMSYRKKYILNPTTLLYEAENVSPCFRFIRVMVFVLSSAAVTLFYFWIFTSVLGLELPKTAFLKMKNAEWMSKMEVMNTNLDRYEEALAGLETRDNDIYRNIFGLNEVAIEIRNAGFGGVDRYAYLDALPKNSKLTKTTKRIDILMKKTYVQSKSFDEIESYSKRAGDMASCIPAVSPLSTDASKFRITSPFGFRSDPFTGITKMHTGIDFGCKSGNPVYASGDGIVEKVSFALFGYGNSVILNHGFGYKTRYAHLSKIYVVEGMKVKRGENIGDSGCSGRASGPHLHYEVIYKGRYVNPSNYFDLEMPVDEYESMVVNASSEFRNIIVESHK